MSLLSLNAWAQSEYKLGVQAYQNKQYEKAREYWEHSAADGNLSASFNLALLLTNGLGGAVDTRRALELFQKVADAGLAIGQFNLGLAYYSGNGVAKNNNQARIWWERAARQGHTQSQFNLGALLWNGEGVEKNQTTALKWFRKASDGGNLQARSFLDNILNQSDTGKPGEPLDTPVTDKDPAIAKLLETAATAYQSGNFKGAFTDWKQAADQGSAIAQYQLAKLYRDGKGTQQDEALAFELNQRSAEANLPQAQFRLARDYLEGKLVKQNNTLALYWMQSAADQGHIKARNYLERLR